MSLNLNSQCALIQLWKRFREQRLLELQAIARDCGFDDEQMAAVYVQLSCEGYVQGLEPVEPGGLFPRFAGLTSLGLAEGRRLAEREDIRQT